MREIKFRAWHREKKCWFDSVRIYGDGSWSGSIVEERGEIDGYDEREGELMQYTGLKDKNSKAIYEGDIVHHLKYGENWQIIWLDDACGYSLKGRGENLMHLSRLCETNIEVIGNIYEGLTEK